MDGNGNSRSPLRKTMYWLNFDSACDIALTVRTLSMTIGNSIGSSNQTNQSCVNQLLRDPSISPSNHFGWNYFEMGKHSRMWKDLGRRFPSPLARVLQTEWICFPWGTSTSNVMHSTMHCTMCILSSLSFLCWLLLTPNLHFPGYLLLALVFVFQSIGSKI